MRSRSTISAGTPGRTASPTAVSRTSCSRILGVRDSRPSHIDAGQDLNWHTHVTLEIGPYPGLSDAQKKVIALDYSMRDGKVQLLRPEELSADWDPATDQRFTYWEAVHHLIRLLGSGGEPAAAELVARLGSRAETARELAYRLYNICDRKKRAAEALQYNALVQSFPEITRLAREGGKPRTGQTALFGETEE